MMAAAAEIGTGWSVTVVGLWLFIFWHEFPVSRHLRRAVETGKAMPHMWVKYQCWRLWHAAQ